MPDFASSPASFISVRPPEAAPYAGPNMAGPLMQAFSSLPDQYFAGKQMQQQLQQMQPVIDPRTGKVVDPNDPQAISTIQKAVLERGGVGAAAGLIPQLFKQQVLGSPTTPTEPPAGTGSPNYPQGASPNNFYSGGRYTGEGDTQGGETIRTLATGLSGGRDVSPVISATARSLRIGPDQPLSPDQAKQVKTALSQGISGGTGQLPPGENGPTASPGQEGETTGGPSSAVDARSNVPSSTPVAAGSAVSGGPAPLTNARETPVPQQTRPQGYGPNPASVLVPQEYRNGRELEYARMLRGLADQDRQQARREGIVGIPSKALEDRAAARDKKAEMVESALEKYSQEQAKVPITGQEQIQKQDIDRSGTTFSGIVAKARAYQQEQKGFVDLTRSILNTPGVYTGALSGLNMAYNRAKAMLGDANAAALQEAIGKITAQNTLAQINAQRFDLQEAGEKSSRIFSQQVDQVSKSSIAYENTVRGNLFLANVQDRMGALSDTMMRKAIAYRQAHGGVLDDGWDTEAANYLRNNPIFTTEEQQHPEYLAAPTPPPGLNAGKLREWERGMGLSPGEVISVANPRQEGSRLYVRIPPEKP